MTNLTIKEYLDKSSVNDIKELAVCLGYQEDAIKDLNTKTSILGCLMMTFLLVEYGVDIITNYDENIINKVAPDYIQMLIDEKALELKLVRVH